MSRREERPAQSSRLAVLPPLSSRTLHHPSFLPHYMTAHFDRQHRNCNSQEAHPIVPAEFFYSDPTMWRGARIHNEVTGLRVLDFFNLNTPPPLMSTGLGAPNRPDPFRCGPYPTLDLGSASWMLPHRRPAHLRRGIVQLSQEEDQAITNLLKLHHQSPLAGSESSSAAILGFFSAAGPPLDFNSRLFLQTPAHHTSANEPLRSHVQQRRAWSDSELEAANTLLSRFVLSQVDEIWHQCDHEPVERCLGFLPDQSSSVTETQHGSEALPASSALSQQNLGFCCTGQKVDASWQDAVSAEDGLASGGLAEVRGQTLSDSEGDAVHVLLSLGETEPVEPTYSRT